MEKRFSDEQIISILREAEAEVSARELSRKPKKVIRVNGSWNGTGKMCSEDVWMPLHKRMTIFFLHIFGINSICVLIPVSYAFECVLLR